MKISYEGFYAKYGNEASEEILNAFITAAVSCYLELIIVDQENGSIDLDYDEPGRLKDNKRSTYTNDPAIVSKSIIMQLDDETLYRIYPTLLGLYTQKDLMEAYDIRAKANITGSKGMGSSQG